MIIHDAQAYSFFRVGETPACWWREVGGVRFAKVRPLVNTLPWWVQTGP